MAIRKKYTVVYETEYETDGDTINRLPVLEEDVVFVRKYHYQSKINNNGARRSISYGAIAQSMDPNDLHEATPLLLHSRLNELLTPPADECKRVGKVIGKSEENYSLIFVGR